MVPIGPVPTEPPPPVLLMPGALLGPYRLVRLLGAGGMGDVYEAVHEALGRPVALKVLRPGSTSPDRFLREGRAAAAVRHPHVVEVTDVGVQDGIRYLVMELIAGEALSEHLARRHRLPLTEALQLTLPLVDALAHAHDCGVIHRDIKPSNVMLTSGSAGRPHPKLVDFGLSKLVHFEADPAGLHLTNTYAVLGSPHYMSPEQCRSTRDVDEATDQYSLGVLLYELLAGVPPFEGGTVWELFAAIQRADVRPIGDIVPGLPDAFVQVLGRCIAFEPTDRFPSMRALGAHLVPWASPRDQESWTPIFGPGGSAAFATTIRHPAPVEGGSSLRPAAQNTTASLPPSNVPLRATSFVGREQVLNALADALGGTSRLVTVRGPGGCGKTRLAQEFAAQHRADFPGGVWFCELAGTRSRHELLREVAAALGVPILDDAGAEAQLGRALESRGRVLVILDNLEQVVETTHGVLSAWLGTAPEAHFLATSRESLRIEGETVLTLGSLDPASAVQLFEDRARAVLASFVVNEENRPAVEAIVKRLDGLCLAIELAAARCSVLPPERLLEQLSQRFRLLKSNRRDLPPRQATIRGAIEWSWNLLDPWEALALTQCGVFRGGFTFEAAEAVLDLTPWPDAPWVLDVLQQLVDKSLLRRIAASRGRERFGLYESVQAFALEELRNEGSVRGPDGAACTGIEAERACRERHARHFASFGSEASLACRRKLEGAHRWLELAFEQENLAEAVETGIEFGDGELAARAVTVLLQLAERQGQRLPAVEAARRVVQMPQMSPQARARMVSCLGNCLRRLGQGDEASDCCRRATELVSDGPPELLGDLIIELAWDHAKANNAGALHLVESVHAALAPAVQLCEEFDLPHTLCRLRVMQATLSSFFEQADAPRLLQEALDLAEQQQDVEELERIHTALGGYYQTQGEPERAFEHFRRTRECEPYTGNRMRGDMNIALLYWGTGDLEEARRLFSAALSTAVRAGDPGSEIIASLNLGYTLMLEGKLEEAERRMLQTLDLLSPSSSGDARTSAWIHHALGRLRLAQGRLDEARLELEEAEQVPNELLQKHNRVRWTLARAELETLSGRLSAARIALDGAARVVRDAPVRERSVVAELERVREMLEACSHR